MVVSPKEIFGWGFLALMALLVLGSIIMSVVYFFGEKDFADKHCVLLEGVKSIKHHSFLGGKMEFVCANGAVYERERYKECVECDDFGECKEYEVRYNFTKKGRDACIGGTKRY